MLGWIRNHFRNHVVGYIALFVALTGTAYAAGPLKRGDPAGGDLTGTYPNPTLAAGAVTPAKFGTIPAARAKKTSSQSIPDVTNTAVTFEAENFDTAGLHSTSVNNSRMTAPTSGVYQVSAGVAWEANSQVNRMLGLTMNGGACCFATSLVPAAVGGADTMQTVSDLVKLSAGDFVEAVVRHATGGNLAVKPASFVGPTPEVSFLAMTWVGPG